MGLAARAAVGLLGNRVGARAVEGGVIVGVARVHPHGRGNHFEDASGVVQLGDVLILPLNVPEIARTVGLRVQNPVAVLVQDVSPILILEEDAVLLIQLRLGAQQFLEVGQIGLVAVGVIGIEIRLAGHGQNGAGVHVHDDGAAPVLHVVGGDGLVEVPFYDLLDGGVQGEDQVVAVLGLKGGGAAVGDGVAPGVADGHRPAVHTGQHRLVGFLQAVKTLAVGVAEAQHRGRKGPVGVAALPGAAGIQGEAAIFLAVLLGKLDDGVLDSVVDLDGQGLVLAVDFGEHVVDALVLAEVGLAGGVHLVQADAIPREQPQRQLPADLGASRFVEGADGAAHDLAGSLVHALKGLAGIKGRAVTGVAPDVPHHVGRNQGFAGGVVDLAPVGLDGQIQQLLAAGIPAVHFAVPDLDDIQAAHHNDGGQQHSPNRDKIPDPPVFRGQTGLLRRPPQAIARAAGGVVG